MNRYLVFAVAISPGAVLATITSPTQPQHKIEAASYDEALEKGAAHIALHVGEQLAVVRVGKVLTEAVKDTVALGQASG